MNTTQTQLPAWLEALGARDLDRNDPELVADSRREHKMETRTS